jgi:hypothetical protein
MHDDAAATERPFHASQWPRPIADPEAYDGGERLAIAWDLGAVAEARKKQLIAAWIRRLPALRQVRRLNLWSCVTQPLFDVACAMEGLECLQIKWSHVREIDAIARLGTLRYLYIGSSTRIASVAPLAALKACACCTSRTSGASRISRRWRNSPRSSRSPWSAACGAASGWRRWNRSRA